jgi:uncharacterized protein (DUF924 family)
LRRHPRLMISGWGADGMGDDLVRDAGQVHDAAREVLRFWFEETPPEKRFRGGDALDEEIKARFGALRDRVLASGAKGWTGDPMHLLAAIIVLDQFSRNMYRGEAEAFAADWLSLRLAKLAVANGWDTGMTGVERQFCYLPFEHSENLADQRESMRLLSDVGDAEVARYARDHGAVIERFGRFPSRNAALGRESTLEELEYLSQPGAGW